MSQAIATTPRPALAPSAASTPVSGWRGSLGSVSTRQSSSRQRRVGLRDDDRVEARPSRPWLTTRETSGRLASSTSAFGVAHAAAPHLPLTPRPPSLAASSTQSLTGLASCRKCAADLIEIDAARAAGARARGAARRASRSPVAEALGRVLAEDVTSADPVPGFDNSAMDGYAVRAADTAAPRRGAGRADGRRRVAGRPPGGARARRRRGDRDLDRRDAARRRRRGGPGRGHRRRARARSRSRVEVEPGSDIRRAGEDIEAGGDGAARREPRSAPPSSGCSPRSAAPRSTARAGRGSRC